MCLTQMRHVMPWKLGGHRGRATPPVVAANPHAGRNASLSLYLVHHTVRACLYTLDITHYVHAVTFFFTYCGQPHVLIIIYSFVHELETT